MLAISAFLSLANRAYSTLTRQMEAVIMFQALRLSMASAQGNIFATQKKCLTVIQWPSQVFEHEGTNGVWVLF